MIKATSNTCLSRSLSRVHSQLCDNVPEELCTLMEEEEKVYSTVHQSLVQGRVQDKSALG